MAVRQEDVISRLKGGETLIHVIERENGQHKPFQYLSGGGRVTAATYRKLTDPENPCLQPVSSGLFPDAEPQEWGWVHE
jgi:hypothetical protein